MFLQIFSLRAGENDIAINFMILPEFFDIAYEMAGQNNVLADFLVNILRQDEERGEYLYFKVSEVLQIQNLLENIIYSLVTGKGEDNTINQTTMGLIFLYLLDSVQYVEMRLPDQYENMVAMTTLDYIEQKYKDATLTELCETLHLPMHVLSRMIKKSTGYNFKELLQRKRLKKAVAFICDTDLTELCETLHLPMHVLSRMIKKSTGYNFKELLQRKRLKKAVAFICDTDLAISDIIAAVGYENSSYFHRLFKERYGMTPREFRIENRKKGQVRL